jgi:hypothetical protein
MKDDNCSYPIRVYPGDNYPDGDWDGKNPHTINNIYDESMWNVGEIWRCPECGNYMILWGDVMQVGRPLGEAQKVKVKVFGDHPLRTYDSNKEVK